MNSVLKYACKIIKYYEIDTHEHRDSLIFQYEAASTFDSTALHATFLSLSLSEKDKLRVIHCSDNNLIQDLKDVSVIVM